MVKYKISDIYITLKDLKFSIFLNFISSISLAFFISFYKSSFFIREFISSLFFLNLFWIGYSFLKSYLAKLSFKETLKKDSFSYLPLLLLSLYKFKEVISVSIYHNAFLEYILSTLLITVSVGGIVFIKALFLNLNPMEIKIKSFSKIFLWLLIIVAGVYFYYFLLLEHGTFCEDSRYYHNLIWNLSQGNFHHTVSDLKIRTHIFGTHLSLLAFPLAAIYWFFKDIRTLIFLQSFLLAAGIFPIFYLSKKLLKSDFAGICFSFAYLLHPVIQFGHFWGVTLDMFGVALFMFALYFLFENKSKFFLLFIFLTMFTKEIFAVLVVPLGVYIYFILKKRKLGILVCFSGVIYFLVAAQITKFLNMGIDMHQDFRENLLYFIGHPLAMIKYYFDPRRIESVTRLLSSLGFLSLLNPTLLLVGAPFLFISFLDPGFYQIDIYRLSPLAPLLILAAISGVAAVNNKFKYKNFPHAISFYVLTVSFLSFYFYNPFNYYKQYYPQRFKISRHNELVREAIKIIPEEASVSVTAALRGILAKRKEIYYFPATPVPPERVKKFGLPQYKYSRIRDVDYVVVDITYPYLLKDGVNDENIQWLLKNKDYGIVSYRDGLIIFKKGYDYEKGFFNLCLTKKPEIEYKKEIVFNEKLKLLGYNIEQEKAYKGSTIYLKLFWEVLEDINEKYVILLKFWRKHYSTYNRDTELIHHPVRDLYPTNLWRKGDIIRDEIPIDLGGNFAILSEPYKIRISLMKMEEKKGEIGELFILPDF